MDVSSDSKHFPREKNHQPHFPSMWQLFLWQHFHSTMSFFLSFFRPKKAAALRQELMQSHTTPQTSRSWFQKSPFQAAVGAWTHLTSILYFTGTSASCWAEQQCQRDAEESPLEELSTEQIKTSVCDKQQPLVKSAHSKDHIFSQTRPQFLFVLSHHCFETW